MVQGLQIENQKNI